MPNDFSCEKLVWVPTLYRYPFEKKEQTIFSRKKCISEDHLLGSKSMGWNTMKLGFLEQVFS